MEKKISKTSLAETMRLIAETTDKLRIGLDVWGGMRRHEMPRGVQERFASFATARASGGAPAEPNFSLVNICTVLEKLHKDMEFVLAESDLSEVEKVELEAAIRASFASIAAIHCLVHQQKIGSAILRASAARIEAAQMIEQAEQASGDDRNFHQIFGQIPESARSPLLLSAAAPSKPGQE